MTRKTIEEAKPEEVREFARVALGLEIGDREHKNTIVEKMRTAGYSGDEITVIAPVEPRESQRGRIFKDDKGRDCMMIIIPESDEAGEDDFVPVGVNGVTFQLKRGVPIPAPLEVIEILDHCVYDKYDQTRDGNRGISVPRQVPKYPYRLAG